MSLDCLDEWRRPKSQKLVAVVSFEMSVNCHWNLRDRAAMPHRAEFSFYTNSQDKMLV